MGAFKKASDIEEKTQRAYPPEIKDVLLNHLKTFGQPVTVTSAVVILNRNKLNPSRAVIKHLLDSLVEAGRASMTLNGNVCEYVLNDRQRE